MAAAFAGTAFAGTAFVAAALGTAALGRGSLGRRSLGHRSLGRSGLRRSSLRRGRLRRWHLRRRRLGRGLLGSRLRRRPRGGCRLRGCLLGCGRLGRGAGGRLGRPAVAVVAVAPRVVVFGVEVVPAADVAVVRVVTGAFFAGALDGVFVAAFVAGAAALAVFLVARCDATRRRLRGAFAAFAWDRLLRSGRGCAACFAVGLLVRRVAVDRAAVDLRRARPSVPWWWSLGPVRPQGGPPRTPWRRRTAHDDALLRPPGRCRPWCWPPHEIRSIPRRTRRPETRINR